MEEYIVHVFEHLSQTIQNRLDNHFHRKGLEKRSFTLRDNEYPSALSRLINHYRLSDEEVILLLTSLVPHIIPGYFEKIIQKYLPHGGDFPEFGGTKGENYRGFIPTGETVLFILFGLETTLRLRHLSLFDPESVLFKHKVLSLEQVKAGEPLLSGRLIVEPEFVEVFTTGKLKLPALSIQFPAEHISTQMHWEDLILPEPVLNQVKEIQIWLNHQYVLMKEWEIGKKLKPGYRVLFYGPPGTGKTLTATLLGKYTGREVFRIDLSMIVSKYIGETEKNLSSLFDKAEHKDWILFFDEADAIFGKRTGVRDAHDKYANQEVSYLLQRIEAYNGLVILASNFRNNIDTAFIRRFNSTIYFPAPKTEDKILLWQKSLPDQIQLADDLQIREIAEKYDLTGSHILNIVQYISLVCLESKKFIVSKELMIQSIKRELEKEGK